tara:strand:- start:51 stop:326 length:276 start_codon:yes stop_codon:yes gene_type:complete
MAKKKTIVTDQKIEELQKLANEMIEIAAGVVSEYDDLDLSSLSELSGSLTQIHEDSPFLDELLKGDSWKKIIKNIPQMPTVLEEKKKDDTK